MVYIQRTFYPARRKYSGNNLIAKKNGGVLTVTRCCRRRVVKLEMSRFCIIHCHSLMFSDVLAIIQHTHTHTRVYLRTLYMNFFVERCSIRKMSDRDCANQMIVCS